MWRRSFGVLLACVAVAVMVGQLRPTNEHMTGPDRPVQHVGRVIFATPLSLPPTTTTTPAP